MRLLSELMRRRIPQVVGLYLAAGWGVLQFIDWAVGHFDLMEGLTNLVAALWLLLLPFVVLVAWRWGRGAGGPIAADIEPGAPKSIAVLPFANLTDNPDNDYLSDGITEEISNALSRIGDLKVVSRTSAFAYKGRSDDVRAIGAELHVGSVLEGGVQLAGKRLRITTRLVDVGSGYQLWSDRYDREMKDIFEVQDDIAESVVRALRVVLHDRERRALTHAPTASVEAYEYYLRGRQFFHQTRRKSLEYAREMFTRAIEIDPEYALAYAGIANASSFIHTYYPSTEQDLERADRASLKALELGPDLAEAQAARGFALFQMRRYDEAEEHFKAAIELDPEFSDAWYFYGRACFEQGRLAEAAHHFDEAARVGQDYQAAFFGAQSHEALGDKDRARAAYREALAVVEKHMALNPDDPRAATMRAVSLSRLGEQEEALHWAERALEIDPLDASVRYNVACLYALEGMADRAIDCLEEAFSLGVGAREWIEHDPDLDSLRDDPRFQALLQGKLGAAPKARGSAPTINGRRTKENS